MLAYPHERFAVEVTFPPAMVAAYAAAGDTHPVHHDPTFAATTHYRRLIASGTPTTAVLLGLTASHYRSTGLWWGSHAGCACAARSPPTQRCAWHGWWCA